MNKNEIPLLDDFYDDIPFLTPEKARNEEQEKVYEIVKERKIKTAVVTWLSADRISKFLEQCEYINEDMIRKHYVWKNKILFCILTIGAPVAVGTVEHLRADGIKNIIAFGTAGSIDEGFDTRKVIVIEKAIRDEGASYHYLPADLYVDLNKDFADKMAKFFEKKDIDYVKGITWTTDAFYRETKQRIAKRIAQGALAVEMECSALASACKFYGLNFGQFLFFSDAVNKENWSMIGTREQRKERKIMFCEFAIEFAETL